MKAPKVKAKPLESSTQVMGKNEILLKKEHKAIYDYFVKVLEGKAKLKENKGITDHFISAYKNILLNNVNLKDISSLSEENFCQFLLSVFKEVREKKLANKENLENDERKKLVDDCVADIRVTEAKDSLIKLIGLPLGIKIDPKNISSSFMNGVKEKIPFLSKDKKEEDEPPLSDEEMVTTFLRKSLFPIIALTTVILLGGLSGPVSVLGLFIIPHVIVIGFIVFGLAAAEYKAVKGLFFNDKKGTLYNPHSRDEKERKEWDNEISGGINKILEIEVKKIPEQISEGRQEQSAQEQAPQGGNKGSEQLTMLDGKITIDQPAKSTGQQP